MYSFVKQSNEIQVIKTRTLNLPEDITEVVGNLRRYEGNEHIGCYGNDPILLIDSIDWKEFDKRGCNLTAAIIRVDEHLRHRASAPLQSSTTLPFPIVLMYDADQKTIGKKL